MLCAILTYLLPKSAPSLLVGYVSAFSTKLSDTVASEIGKAFGKNTYLITTMKLVPRGTEGAVSAEGTLAGIVASIIIAALGVFLHLVNLEGAGCAVVAALIATTIESYIGAVFQDDVPWLSNELVNLINTIIGAAAGVLLYSIIGR